MPAYILPHSPPILQVEALFLVELCLEEVDPPDPDLPGAGAVGYVISLPVEAVGDRVGGAGYAGCSAVALLVPDFLAVSHSPRPTASVQLHPAGVVGYIRVWPGVSSLGEVRAEEVEPVADPP